MVTITNHNNNQIAKDNKKGDVPVDSFLIESDQPKEHNKAVSR